MSAEVPLDEEAQDRADFEKGPMAVRAETIADLPNFQARASFALLSTFLPPHYGQPPATFVKKVDAADPERVIRYAEALDRRKIAFAQREVFERVLRIAKSRINETHV